MVGEQSYQLYIVALLERLVESGRLLSLIISFESSVSFWFCVFVVAFVFELLIVCYFTLCLMFLCFVLDSFVCVSFDVLVICL